MGSIRKQFTCAASILVLIGLLSTGVYAQPEFRFQHYTTRQGLSWNVVQHIVQDSLGFIWFQGNADVTRFDGETFRKFMHAPEDGDLALGTSQIRSLASDEANGLWVIHFETDNESFYHYDYRQDGFRAHRPATPYRTSAFHIEQKYSSIWLAAGPNFYRYDLHTNNTEQFFFNPADTSANYPWKNISDFADYDSLLVLATTNGLWAYHKIAHTFFRPPVSAADSATLYNSMIFKFSLKENGELMAYVENQGMVHLDHSLHTIRWLHKPELRFSVSRKSADGYYWFGTRYHGLWRFDPRDNSWLYMMHEPGNPHSICSNRIGSLLIDRENNIWAGSYGHGVSMLRNGALPVTNYHFPEQAIRNISTYAANGSDFLVVAKTNINASGYKSTSDIEVFDITGQRIRSTLNSKFEFDFQGPNTVQNIVNGRDHLWLSVYPMAILGIPYNYMESKIEGSKPIITAVRFSPDLVFDRNNLWEDRQGNLWITSSRGVKKIYSASTSGDAGPDHIKTKGAAYRVMAHQDQLWISTSSGIEVADVSHAIPDSARVHLSPKNFFHYHLQGDSLYFVSGRDIYLDRGYKATVAIQKIGELKEEEIHAMTVDRLGRIWVSTGSEFICYDPATQAHITLAELDGLHYPASTRSYLLQDSRGRLISMNDDGLTIVDPQMIAPSTFRVQPVLVSLEINNKPVRLQRHGNATDDFVIREPITTLNELVLDYLHNDFSIVFSAMQMTDPRNSQYRFKLEGYDQDWIATSAQNRRARYTNLNPGTYTFRVRATNHHGIWSDTERTLRIKLMPPPWKTAWAYTAYTVFILGVLLMATRSIIRRERLTSSLKLRELELEKAREIDRIKTAFFTNISHEFRTPLTLIKGPTQQLLEQTKNAHDKHQLQTIERNAELLLKQINQLLELARLESGIIPVHTRQGNLNAFINSVASSFLSLAEQKVIQFTIQLPEIHYRATLDYDKLETILINLIGNALKFTPEKGSITIQGGIEPVAAGVSSLVITVTDSGPGIPKELHSKIFERFYQVSESHHQMGTGIGLALAKELTELLGGTISVKSTPDIGSAFTVTLPVTLQETLNPEQDEAAYLQQPNPSTPIDTVRVESQENNLYPKVLVVEDHADLRHFIIASLGQAYQFIEAANGLEGLNLAQQEMPDLIISDVMMPEMDGMAMTAAIRKDIRISHTPIILLTANTNSEAKMTGLSRGADDYLIKPFDKTELNWKVRNLIARQETYRDQARIALLKEVPRKNVLSEDDQFLERVKTYILDNLSNENLSVESVAEAMGMSRSTLFRKVTALTGSTVNELIRSFRLQKAAQLLEQKWGPVSQVAYQVGFTNLSYFSKCFREQFGVLPSDYPH
jgi:signal transduction histidine kinase/DNA-binding response OmpR family regulator/ligand-binding sensor domain-containing protein